MNSKRKYFVYLAIGSLIGLLMAIWMIFFRPEPKIIYNEDPYLHQFPDENYIFGIGTVIPSTEEIHITSPLQHKIIAIPVKEGENVTKGTLLIQLYKNDLLSNLKTKKIALKKAEMELNKLLYLPRNDEVVIKDAAVQQATVAFDEAERQLRIAEDLFQQHAISEGELNEKTFQVKVEKAKLTVAKAELELLKAGAWNHDLELASAEIEFQESLVEEVKEQILETMITAPIDGTILKINAHIGEVPDINAPPLMILGGTDELYIKVSIDENNLFKLTPGQPATGYFREINAKPIPLNFVRIEPMVVPKKNLTGSTTERVDTRVLKVIYRFENTAQRAYVGQQMDVYIHTQPDKS